MSNSVFYIKNKLNFRLKLLLPLMLICAGMAMANTEGITQPELSTGSSCSALYVDISTACLIPCESSDYYVRYCNLGDETAMDAYVIVTFDSTFTINSTSIPISSQSGNTLTFNLGDVPPGFCNTFSIDITLACNVVPGQSHCVDAQIFPDENCDPTPPNWDGSNIIVNIACQGDSIYFTLENNGSGDMSQPSQCIIIEDDLVVMVSGYNLPSGGDTTIVLPNNGGFYHFEAGQTPGNPNNFFVAANTEGCNVITPGYLTQYPADDGLLAYESTCTVNTPACLANKKLASPEGTGPDHRIGKDIPIQYQINFQNESSDTVNTVVVCDTLSNLFDTLTFLPGVSSDDYSVQNMGNNIIKFTFDNIDLLPGESGFIKFQIELYDDTPECAPILNWAGISYDTVQVLTDTVYQLGNCNESIVTDTSVTICDGGGYYLGNYYTQSSSFSNTTNFGNYTSSYNVAINVFLGTPDETIYATICEGGSYTYNGQNYNAAGTYEIPMMDENGCPYTVTLVITVIENVEEIINVSICDGESYDFFGENLTDAGIYSHVEPLGACFKITILVLAVHPNHAMTTEAEICQGDSLEWEGGVYYADTTVVHYYSSQYGCDSLTKLELTVHPNYHITLDTAICEGDSFYVGTNGYAAAGDYIDTLTTFHGCDSVVELHLSILPKSSFGLAVVICQGESFPIGGHEYDSPGTYEIILTAANGCDSIVTLELVVQNKNPLCHADAGPDTLVCGYSYSLVGSPSPGSWEVLCNVSAGTVEMDSINGNSVNVTVAECGTYYFKYTHSHIDTLIQFDTINMVFDTIIDTCMVSDIVRVDFEDPSKRIQSIDLNMSLGYNDYTCHENEGVTCGNIYTFDEVSPTAGWVFDLSVSCQSTIYHTAVDSLIGECTANDIDVQIIQFDSNFGPFIYDVDQGAFIELDSNGQTILGNELLAYLDSLYGIGLDMLDDQCPPAPAGCFPPPYCEPVLIEYDTNYIEVPVRLGGNWTYLDSLGQNIPLEDSTVLTINDLEYLFIITPNATTYSPVNFELWRLEADSSLSLPTQPIDVELQWQEHWVLDSIQVITPVYEPLPDSCLNKCLRGNLLNLNQGPMPGIPVFDCPPFTITFNGTKLELHDNIICDTNTYIVQITIDGGTPPYTLTGLAGQFISTNVFESVPLALNQGYQAFVEDAEGCRGFIEGEECRCKQYTAEALETFELNCMDSCITLVGTVNGVGDDWLAQWFYNGQLLATGTSALACDTGFYMFVVEDLSSGCADTAITELIIHFPIAEAGPNQSITCATPLVELLGEELTGDTQVTYFWEGPGITPSNQTSPTPTVGEAGLYILTVTNLQTGCEGTDSVTVFSNEIVPTAIISPPAQLNCYHPQITLSGVNSTPFGQITFSWSTVNGNIIGQSNTANIAIDQPGNYRLLVTHNASGCHDEALVAVTADFIPPQSISAGPNKVLNCTDPTRQLEGTIGSSNIAFHWSTLNGSIVTGANTLTPVVDQAGDYFLAATDTLNGCSTLDSVSVSENFEEPIISFNDPDTLDCNTSSVGVSAEILGSNLTYHWSTLLGQIAAGIDAPAATVTSGGVYFLQIINNSNGCVSTDSILVLENLTAPLADAGIDTFFSCNTVELALNGANSSAGNSIIYQWETLNGSINSGEMTLTPTIESPGIYLLSVTDSLNGCIGQDTVIIEAYKPVSFDILTAPDCQDSGTGSVLVTNIQGQADNYFFMLDKGQARYDSLFSGLLAGDYTLTVLNSDSCKVEADVTIGSVAALPPMEFEETYHFCGVNNPLLLAPVLGIDTQWVKFAWSNGDSMSSTSIFEDGMYSVTVTTPCESRTYEFSVIDDEKNSSFFEMPNAFSPNGDQTNDEFGPVSPNQLLSYEMLVFDRWGQKVFSTSKVNERWDGTYKGHPVNSDVYIYRVVASFLDCKGEKHRVDKKGDLTLLR